MIHSKLAIIIAAIALLGLSAVTPDLHAQEKCCKTSIESCENGVCTIEFSECDTVCCDSKNACGAGDVSCQSTDTCCGNCDPASPKGIIALIISFFKL